MDIQFRFVREYYENGVTLVQFISTVQQRSDVITKNVDSKTALCHFPSIVGEPPSQN